ncbi:MAG: TonB-dependent receptor [Betaproteobacteria bacterium]|nr:MAG: TonB-dependent receptor [Betaproteobacteria bacterium]
MTPIRRSVAEPSLAVLLALPFAPLVHAQQVPPSPTGTEAPEQVVVTAQKRASALQDVPFSVAAPSEAQIRNSGADNIVDLARNVAGLSIADLGPGQSQIAIRGISSGQVIRDQPGVKEQVGVYLDESPISVALFTPDLVLYDLARFEVLRGPQGTLFGAGSESGTLRYITNAPRLGVFEGNVEATGDASTTGDGGGSLRGMVNLPLGTVAALRSVLYKDHAPGFIDAVQPNGGLNKNVNSADREGGRIALLWKLTDDLTLEPRYVFQRLETGGYPRVDLYNILANPYTTTQPAVTLGDRQQFTQQQEGIEDLFHLADLKIDYDLGSMALTSITSYTDRAVTVLRDATQLSGSVTFDLPSTCPAGTTCPPFPHFPPATPAEVRLNSPLYDRTNLSVVSEEVRLASTGKATIDWLGGLFWQHIDRHYGQDLPTPGYDAFSTSHAFPPSVQLAAPPDTPFYSNLSYKFRQYAAFGEGTWHMTDQLGVTLGLRYYGFEESRTQSFGGLFGCCSTSSGSVNSNGFSPRAIVTYKLTNDILFDAQVSRGFRLGGINDPLNIPLCTATDIQVFGGHPTWRDEKAWNYEVGAKTQFLDRKVTFNASAFWTEIYNLQATTTAGQCSSRIVFNVPTAHSTGLEAELFARPTANWDFGLSATWVNAVLTSTVTTKDTAGNTIVVGGLQDGNRLPTAPKLQAVASIGYTQPLQSGRDLFGVFTVQYVGSSFSQFEQEQPGFGQICTPGVCSGAAARLIQFGGPLTTNRITFNPQLPSYTLGNMRLGLRSDRWEVAGFINNIWDKTARLALDYERGRSARVAYLTNAARLFGVTARYSF